MPFSIKRFCKTAIFTGSFISITPMAPNTRTSCTSGKDAAGASSSRSCDSMAFTFSCHPLSNRSETDADAIAQANGFSHESGPVHETPCLTTANHIGYGCTGDGCRQCHVTSRQCLADAHDVRFHPGPFPGEKSPGPSESRCDFIKDQQYLIPVTQFTCRYQECG